MKNTSAPLFKSKSRGNTPNLSKVDRELLKVLKDSLEKLQEKNRALVQQIWDNDRELAKKKISPAKKSALRQLKNTYQEQHNTLLPKIAEKQAAIASLQGEPASQTPATEAPTFSR